MINFKAFGYTPKTIPDSIYHQLKREVDIDKRLDLIYNIGITHAHAGTSDSIVFYAKRMDSVMSHTKQKLSNYNLHQIKAKRLQGDGMYMNGLYENALKAYIEGISIVKNPLKHPEVEWLKIGLGKVYIQKKNYKKAKELFHECLKSAESEIIAQANYCLGVLNFRQNNITTAAVFLDKALAHSGKSLKLILKVELYKGFIAWEEENNDEAFDIFESIMERSLEHDHYDIYTEAVLSFGRIYIQLERYDDAEMILTIAYTNAIQWNRLELQRRVINGLRRVYSVKGDYKNAYNLMTQYLGISNMILKEQNNIVVKDLEYKYQTLQKEKEIFELKEIQLVKQAEINREKTIRQAFLYGFLILLIPILALLYVYYQKLQTQNQLNINQKELNNRKIVSLLNEQELKLARTSLDAQQEERTRIAQELHDSIGGNLAGIKLRMSNKGRLNEEEQGIILQVDETYKLVRSISHDLTPSKFHKNAFTTLIREYVESIKQIVDFSINFLTHPEEKIDNLSETIKVQIYQIIQELFTNTIKHANAKNIDLHLTIYEKTFQLLFEDDGKGFNVAQIQDGIGLSNMRNRAAQLKGELVIDSAISRGTVFTIEIPLEEDL
ncbi:histidine kinase [Flavivirga eckloniae]|uniref:histidine kinase n=2 Tax=Flavivirga eckloniae TaxID=1803846 RepID=A0A2K9PRW3_9FLAO|nr:histidine kinase [Flavivirga eckloniae]